MVNEFIVIASSIGPYIALIQLSGSINGATENAGVENVIFKIAGVVNAGVEKQE